MHVSAPGSPQPDSTYVTGDCVVIVENVFFRVPKYFLERSALMADLLAKQASDPTTVTVVDSSGKGLIVDLLLPEDTCEEFRALCWVFDASTRPHVLQAQNKHEDLPLDDISRLLSIVLISRTYGFDYELWAGDLLKTYCEREGPSSAKVKPKKKYFTQECSEHDLKRLVRYSALVQDAVLLDYIQAAIIESIDNPDCSPPRPSGALNVVEMLSLAETYGLRQLQGDIYYRTLRSMARDVALSHNTFTASALLSHAPAELTVQQKSNILQGVISIMGAWDRIVSDGFTVAAAASQCKCSVFPVWACKLADKEQLWDDILAVACNDFSTVNILERLALMIHEHNRMPIYDSIGGKCRKMFAEHLRTLEKQIKRSLPDYFLGYSNEMRICLTIDGLDGGLRLEA